MRFSPVLAECIETKSQCAIFNVDANRVNSVLLESRAQSHVFNAVILASDESPLSCILKVVFPGAMNCEI